VSLTLLSFFLFFLSFNLGKKLGLSDVKWVGTRRTTDWLSVGAGQAAQSAP
jgi:hypothetical protein